MNEQLTVTQRAGGWFIQLGKRLAAMPMSERVRLATTLAVFAAAVVYMASYGTATAYGANSLNINADTITDGLFDGANIIIGALGAVVFLLIGFTFGAKILAAIGAFVQRISF